MEIFLSHQWKILAESCLLGLIFGAGYDIIRVFHVLWGIGSYKHPHRGILPPLPEKGRRCAFLLYLLGDVVYLSFVAFFGSVFLFHANHGQFRLFLLSGAMAGFILYQLTLGRLVMWVSEALVCLLKGLWRLLVWRPLCFLVRLFGKIGRYTGSRLWRLARWLWHLGPGNLAILANRLWAQRRLNRCIRRLAHTMAFPDRTNGMESR